MIAVNGSGKFENERGGYRHDLAEVGGDEEHHDSAQVAEDHPALLDRSHDGREVVIGQHHVRGFLGDLGPGDAHRDPDVGLLERGRVVHAIAGHGYYLVVLLERTNDAQLVRGGHPCEHRDVAHAPGELVVIHLLEVLTGRRPPRPLRGSRPCARWQRGCGMVPGDHLHVHAGLMRASIAATASGLGGSSSPHRPRKTSPDSACERSASSSPAAGRRPPPREGLLGEGSAAASISARNSS
jgi:hypothetical protein